MRTLEIIILILVTLLPFVKRPILRKIQANYLLILVGVLLLLHLIIEGWRWQMIPAYVLLILLTWRIKAVDLTKSSKLSFIRVIGFVGIVLLLAPAWVLPVVLPVFSFPAPNGTYNVGTMTTHVQTEMDEIITKDPNDKRALSYKIWYPSEADISSLKGEKYLNYGERSGFAMKYGLPATALNYLDLVKTQAYADLPIAQGKFPVLIFSHGYGSKPTGYYALLTEIASHGYVIVNMNHTYESLGATFPDGSVKYFDYGFQHEVSSGSMEVAQPLIDAFKDGSSYEERHPIIREVVKKFFVGKTEDRWAADMLFTLDLLEEWNTNGLLNKSLDLEKIGVFGHSNGGGSAGKVAMRDDRVKAVANLDGIQWGNMIDSTYRVPYLYVSSDWPAEHEDINSHIYINKSTDYFYETKLLKSGHPNFMDIPFIVPVRPIAQTGEIDPSLGIEITNKLVIAFFDKHLKNQEVADPKLVADQYDLLEMTVFKGDSIK